MVVLMCLSSVKSHMVGMVFVLLGVGFYSRERI